MSEVNLYRNDDPQSGERDARRHHTLGGNPDPATLRKMQGAVSGVEGAGSGVEGAGSSTATVTPKAARPTHAACSTNGIFSGSFRAAI